MTGYSFKTFDPATGVAQAFLPDYAGAEISLEYSDIGAVKLEYPTLGKNYSSINTSRIEVGVFYNGVEIDDGRFMMDSNQVDEIVPGAIASFNGRSLLKLTDYCIVYPLSGTSVAEAQVFSTQTAGAILRTLFQQNSTRGGQMSVVTWASFSSTLDSNGNAWAATIGSILYKVGTSYLSIIRNLVDNGIIEVKMVGRDLRVYNAGTMGTDRTVTNPPIVLRKGKDLLEAPTTSTSEQIAGTALIEGDEAVLMETVDTAVNTAWGRRETYISQGGISDTTTLGLLSTQELLRRSAVRRQKTRKIDIKASGLEPNVDYRVSDYIFCDTTGVNEKLRVMQLVISIDSSNVKSASIVLNDKFLESEVAIARKVTGILGGATAAGSISNPNPGTNVDVGIPSQVTGLSWTSGAYQNTLGETKAQITATWTAVTTNTNATVLDDFDHYELQVKRNSSSDWGNEAQALSDTNVAYAPVPSNVTLDVRVRCVDQNGNKGAWSTTSTGVSAADTTAPPTPSTPSVAPYLGQLRAFWDGLGSVGQAMPPDFAYLEVHMSGTTGFTPSTSTMVDQLNARGYAIMTNLTYGVIQYIKFIGVDRAGNKSAASAQGSATPQNVSGLDIAALTVDTSNLANLAVTTAKIGLLQVLNAQIGALAVDDAKIGNVSVGKLTAGSLTADITVSARIKTANTGARVELNSSGLQAYNSSGVATVDIAAGSGNATFVGTFKTDFSSSVTPHIEMINSGDRTTIYFTDNAGTGPAGNAAFMNTPLDAFNSPRIGINTGTYSCLGVSSKQRLFLNTAGGMQLESYKVSGGAIIGYSLDMGATNADITMVDASGNITGGALVMTSTAFNLRRYGTSAILDGGGIISDTNNMFLEAQDVGVLGAQIILQDSGDIWFQGAFQKSNTSGGKAALYTDVWNGVNASGGATITYGVTMGTSPVPIYSIESGSDQGNDRMPVARSTTSFTIQHINSVSVSLHYWAFRIF